MAKLNRRQAADFRPDPQNANQGTERGSWMLQQSLQECGAGRSILADRNGVIVAGNKTLEAAVEAGLPVIEVETDGTELVVVRRKDLDIGEERGRKLAFLDNRVAEVGLQWDFTQIQADLNAGLDLSGLWLPDELDRLALNAGLLDPGEAADQGGSLQVTGEPSGRNSATTGRQRPERDRNSGSDGPLGVDLTVDGAQVVVPRGAEGVSLEVSTPSTQVLLTLTADGSLLVVVGRGGKDLHTYTLGEEERVDGPDGDEADDE